MDDKEYGGIVMMEKAIAAAARLSDGPKFQATDSDEAIVEQLLARRVELRPHPPTELATPVDWEADPFGQRNWGAQLHMLRWIDPLRRVSERMPERRPELMGLWQELVDEWADANLDFDEAAPSAWLSMVEAYRAEALINGLGLTDRPERVMSLLVRHGEWLRDERNLGHSNHALRQHYALFIVGVVLGRRDWIDLSIDRLRHHAETMFDREGVNNEGAVGYWDMNWQWSSFLADTLEAEGMDAQFLRSKLELAAGTLAASTRPDGYYEAIGDTGPLGPATGRHPLLDYAASNGTTGVAPEELASVYTRGFAFGRSGWGEIARSFRDESFYSLVFGKNDKVHGHEDSGGVTFFAGRRPLLVDAGKYAYVDTAQRDYCVGRTGHNVITIDGAHYDLAKEVSLVAFKHSDALDYYVLEDKGYEGVQIRRTVVYSRSTESLLVVDYVQADKEVTARWRWHLQPNARTTIRGANALVRMGDKEHSLLWAGSAPNLSLHRGEADPLEGWYSPSWNKLVPADVVMAVKRAKRSRTAVLIQSEGSDRRNLQSFMIDGGMGYVARGNGKVECIVLDDEGARTVSTDEEHLEETIDQLRIEPTELVVDTRVVRPPETPTMAGEIDERVCKARDALVPASSRDQIREAAQALRDVLHEGYDQGALAALRDFAATYGSGAVGGVPTGSKGHRYGFDFSPGCSKIKFRGELINLEAFERRRLHKPNWQRLGEKSLHIYNLGSLTLPILYRPGSSSELLVCFSGAQDRAKVTLPRFEWQRQFANVDCHQLFVSDPTLDLDSDLRIGWYLGSAEIDLPEKLAALIREYAHRVGAEKIVTMGTSGGGFAALQTAALIPDARSVAVNPQTDIGRYRARFSRQAASVVFGTPEPHTSSRSSVAERLRQAKQPVDLQIILNGGDPHHRDNHVEPLAEACAHLSWVKLHVDEVDWGAGHVSNVPATVEAVLQVLGRSA